jgi:hypothetical protein
VTCGAAVISTAGKILMIHHNARQFPEIRQPQDVAGKSASRSHL